MVRFFCIGSCVISLLIFGFITHLPLCGVLATFITFSIMAFAGIALLQYALPSEKSAFCIIVLGSVVGLMVGRFTMLIVGLWLGLSLYSAVLAMTVMALLGVTLTIHSRHFLPAWTDQDAYELSYLLGITTVTFLLMIPPYWGVGRLTDQGHAFVSYFNNDFLHHISVIAELTRSVPPENPYFVGERLHYYWFYHLWPAVVANLADIRAWDAMVLTLPPTVALFIATLSLLVRTYMRTALVRLFVISLGLLASSYIGLLYITKILFPEMLRLIPNYSHIEYSYLSHSWLRDFLYEPHAVTALSLLIFVIYLSRLPINFQTWLSSVITGTALGATMITDSFIGVVGLVWFGLVHLRSFLGEPHNRPFIALALLMVSKVSLIDVVLKVFPINGSPLTLRIHPMAKFALLYLPMELGSLAVFGTFGLLSSIVRRRWTQMNSMFLLLLVSLLLGFTLFVPLDPDIALRKALKVVQIPLVVLSVEFVRIYCQLPTRRFYTLVGAIVIIPGILTVGTDIAQYVNLKQKRIPPTTYISPEELQVFEWIRTHTPRDATFQILSAVRPEYKFLDTVDLVMSSIGERRTLFENYYHPYALKATASEVARRRSILEQLSTADSAEVVREAIEKLPPFYLYVDENAPGPTEAIRHLRNSGFLAELYRVDHIAVFKVR